MSNQAKSRSPLVPEAVQMIADKLGCSEDEALRRLQERAESMNYRLHNYALLVTEGMVRFDE